LKSSHGAPSLLFNYNVVVLNENEWNSMHNNLLSLSLTSCGC
jgi:hypothetical protein